jgi:HupE / UreJ protein
LRFIAATLVLLAAGAAGAHSSSLVYVELAVVGHDARVTLQIADRDLAPAVGLDREQPVTRAEALARQDALLGYAAGHVHIRNGEADCPPVSRALSIADRADGFFAVTDVDYRCKRTAANLTVEYDLFFDGDPMHQGLARITLPGQPERQHVFRGAARTLQLDRPVTLVDHLRDYLVLGMEHIFGGYDHLSFLFGLMLVAAGRGLSRGARYTLGIVTAFTVAHSVTLICAGLGIVRLPSHLVEPAIALSIAYVAAENLIVAEPRHRWLLTFGFGLIHGFGFASVLQEIGLPPSGVIPSLISFNVGVELGQLCVVAAVAPLLLWLVPRLGLARQVRLGGSVILLLLSTFWFFERVLGRSWFGGMLG